MKLYVLILVIHYATAQIFTNPYYKDEKSAEYWKKLGNDALKHSLKREINTNIAKNVIIFLGDGMGITVNTAGRIYKGQKQGHSGEESILAWEKFPNIALIKTYILDKQVGSSAACATAYMSGVKANAETIGVNGHVQVNDCEASLKEENRVTSFIQWAQDAGKDTGIITTTTITDGTPASTYSHSANRNWECYDLIPKEHRSCKDIATQLVEDEPGRNINVIFGGGRMQMGHLLKSQNDEGICAKENLVEKWQNMKTEMGVKQAYVTNARELREADVEKQDFVMGIFASSDLPYELDRNKTDDGPPSLAEMTEIAIKRLKRNKKGFALLVEGGRIDDALHHSKPKKALEDLLAMEAAVEKTISLVNLDETLIIVTADHSHVMTINGYPPRGNNILGKVQPSVSITDNMPYPTLMFTNGVGFNFTWNGTNVNRINYTSIDTTTDNFISPSLVPTLNGNETHGGEDVGVWAIGPMSHLFHTTHDQTFIAYVMALSACMGPYKDNCDVVGRRGFNSEPVESPPEEFTGKSKSFSINLNLLLQLSCLYTALLYWW